ncbi:conserved hypothetical protein [Uncinocarpus reesii 1704]|uniref:Uncharacterized protein n=1 Tax=Uncinocarpus reesii (strain UAMH 1704) TaxID=336963 RepID=C4JPU5_UNCRE|nr:uncharacterized protein UREG_04588 [Uncinocarpus reesii 1704]EEP79742.1 conserved hypothetical protein [Uncinocarpus reesii 1704]
MASIDPEFPYSLTISLPLPNHRLASSALRALQVDAELSPLVCRTLRLARPDPSPPLPAAQLPSTAKVDGPALASGDGSGEVGNGNEPFTVLETQYKATTNRMLRVAVNAFMESLGVVLGVMEELDVDVLATESKK